MKKFILCALLIGLSYPAFADILLPSRQQELYKKAEQKQQKCPPNKPLVDFKGNCYSCNIAQDFLLEDGMKCSEVCPNRYVDETCGFFCVLKNPPSDAYVHIPCKGWILK